MIENHVGDRGRDGPGTLGCSASGRVKINPSRPHSIPEHIGLASIDGNTLPAPKPSIPSNVQPTTIELSNHGHQILHTGLGRELYKSNAL